MKPTSLVKLLVLPFVLIFVLVAFIWFFIWPQAKSLMGNQTEIKKQNDLFEQVQAKNESLIKASKNSPQISQAADTVNNLWPDSEDVSQFIVQAEGLAANKQIVLDNIAVYEASASTKTNANPSAKTPVGTKFSFNATAPYSSTFDFVAGLEKLARFNTISSIALSSNESTGQINLKLNGNIYAK